MPVARRILPQLAELVLRYDFDEVKYRFEETFGRAAHTYFPHDGNLLSASYALMFHAYSAHRIDDYLEALRTISPHLKCEIDALLGVEKPCPTEAQLLWGAIPMFDRKTLRSTLVEISKKEGPKIVAIEGAEASGKSHSAHLIAFVGKEKVGAEVVTIRLAELLGAKLSSSEGAAITELEPYEIFDVTSDAIGLEVPDRYRTSRAQDVRVVQRLLSWFGGAFGRRIDPIQPVWLIIDDLNFSACPPWVIELCVGLGDRFARGQLADLWVFLIGLPKTRLNPEALYFAAGDIHLPPTPEDVWQFLLKAAAEKDKPLPAAERDIVIQEVWGTAPGPLRHEDLREVTARAKLLLGSL
jgi:hypothetical protein